MDKFLIKRRRTESTDTGVSGSNADEEVEIVVERPLVSWPSSESERSPDFGAISVSY